jgi:hypothetical protein
MCVNVLGILILLEWPFHIFVIFAKDNEIIFNESFVVDLAPM